MRFPAILVLVAGLLVAPQWGPTVSPTLRTVTSAPDTDTFTPQRRSVLRASRSRARPPRTPAVWDRLAACESRGRWHLNTGAFQGGLQFHPATWRSVVRRHRLTYPPFAWQASRGQQIHAAILLQREVGWRAWPGCAALLRLR